MALLTTERLLLRQLTEDDIPALHAMFNDPLVMRYYSKLKDMNETREWLDWNLQLYADRGHGLWGVELKDGGEWIGQVGLIPQRIEGKQEIEVGYLLRSEHWHHGYATEAARACREYALKRLGADRVISLIRPENEPSIKVAERNGMTRTIKIVKWGIEHWVYAIDRPRV
jgi:RimJ/RimL family protein N-acetyltransferase